MGDCSYFYGTYFASLWHLLRLFMARMGRGGERQEEEEVSVIKKSNHELLSGISHGTRTNNLLWIISCLWGAARHPLLLFGQSFQPSTYQKISGEKLLFYVEMFRIFF